jgi:hypothetical protein
MTNLESFLKDNFKVALEYLMQEAKQELEDQGHKNTGATEKSFEIDISGTLNSIIGGKILQAEHAIVLSVLNEGVRPQNIPFSGLSGNGGKSKYIEGLITYVQQKNGGLSIKEATGIAFAIAITQKREGSPTKGSYLYSKNGRRTGWIEAAYSEEKLQRFEELLRIDLLIKHSITNMIANFNQIK